MMIPGIKTVRTSMRGRWLGQARGFTLIELMITVAVVAILGAIAYPSYQDFVQRSRRQEAKAALADAAARQEKFYLNNKTYTLTLGAVGLGMPAVAGEYTITITAATANTYTLQAAPIAGGPQDGDGNMQLTQTGAKSWDRNDDGDFVDPMENCWEEYC